MLEQIRIVLINTSHPGNIGSTARAMKTMGLQKLYLVTPVQFPTSANYTSLNIASAVQIIAYELYIASLHDNEHITSTWDYDLATLNDMEYFFEHLEKVFLCIGFLNPQAPRQLMRRMRRLF